MVFCCHLGSVLHAQSQCAKKAKEVQSFQGIQARSISWHFVRCFAACKTRTKSRWFLCNPQWHVSSNVFTSFVIFNCSMMFFGALVDQFKTFHAGRLCCGQRQPWRTAAGVELRPRTCAKTMSVVLVRNPVIFLVNFVKMQLNVPFLTRVGRHAPNDPDALDGTLLKTVRNVSSAIERAQREPSKKTQKWRIFQVCFKKPLIFFDFLSLRQFMRAKAVFATYGGGPMSAVFILQQDRTGCI